MRTMLFTLTIAIVLGLAGPCPAIASPFCDGYTDGYNKAVCDHAGSCLPATHRALGCLNRWSPKCPWLRGRADTYESGYKAGYDDGKRSVEKGSESQSGDTPPPNNPPCRMDCTQDIKDGTIQSCTTQC